MNELSRGMTECKECGMVVEMCEYHPYAACLMFSSCKDKRTVKENLKVVIRFGINSDRALTKDNQEE